jgi:ABC-type sugar transport system ATPase subunit
MNEIFKVADRVTVLKDGCKVGTSKASDLTEDIIVQMMVGRKIENFFPKSNVQFGRTILKVVNFTRKKVFEDISFELHEGEILGLSGLVGAGRTELARAIFGAESEDSGRLYVNGKEVKIKSPRDSIKKGIAFIPEDRKDQGVITRMTVRENLTLAVLDSIARSGIIDRVKQKKISDDYIKQLNIKTPNMEQKVMNLSGGNQQKVVIGKWLATNPKILILDEPTRGIDVASKVEIYTLMKDLAQKGIGALFISSELPEIVGVCDRILILREGKLVGDILKEEASEENIMNYFMGRAAQ